MLLAEFQQVGKSIGLVRAALQLGVAHFQPVQLRAQSLILFPRVAQLT